MTQTTTKTQLKRINTINKYFNKIRRDMFKNHYTSEFKELYTISDTYMVASLIDEDFEGLNFTPNQEYPPLNRIINNYNLIDDNNKNLYIINITIKELKEKLKGLKKDAYIILNDESHKEDIYFNVDLMKKFILLLNFKNNENVTFKATKNFTPFFTKTKRGSKGCILPLYVH